MSKISEQLELSRSVAIEAGVLMDEIITLLFRRLSNPCKFQRTAAVLLLRVLATGDTPPFPDHALRLLAEKASKEVELDADPLLQELQTNALRTIRMAYKSEYGSERWIELFGNYYSFE